jgi:pseudo-rSAM protein
MIKTVTNYWFTIEPYVYVRIANNCALLYNTLDGATLESDKIDIIELLQETLRKENCGVVLLTSERYKAKDTNNFIRELRGKYMGDIIDITLSKGKPIQLLPFFNFCNTHELYKKHNFSPYKNVLENLSEISIHIDTTTNLTKLIPFLQSVPSALTFNIIGNLRNIINYEKLLSFFDQYSSPKNVFCSYTNVISLQPDFENNFSYKISVHFPIDKRQWNNSQQLLLNQTLPFEYIFDVSSLGDCRQAEQIIEQFQIEKYHINPVYTGDNIGFFEENVFLKKKDILSTSMSIKDFFSNQSMNIYDFGKINIMPNGDVFANVNDPALGNICMHNISEIVQIEVEEGKSWFRVRNQAPCNNCIYQWLCPPPSNYEIAIGRPNLCHVKQ